MTGKKSTKSAADWKALMMEERDFLGPLMQMAVQEVLEAEMNECVGAQKGERTDGRLGYRSGYYPRGLLTRAGRLELRVPQDRAGKFSTDVFERYQRSEKALVSAVMEMYVQGVSTRNVKAIAEELCGHSISASTVSEMNKKLDGQPDKFANRRLEQEYPYLIVEARYERVREDGRIVSRAVLIAIGINWEGRREVLGVELASRETQTSWRDFLLRLKERGLCGVELVVSDDHAGLKRAIQEVFTRSAWQRCYVHFLRNAPDHLPRKGGDDCLTELRWLYDRRDEEEARRDLAGWLKKWQEKYPRLCDWVEANIEETFTFYRQPREHHKHLKSTNLLERLNQEIRRRTLVVRIFPNVESALRLILALAVEQHEEWIEQHRYLNMDLLKEQKKEHLMKIAA